MLIVIGKEPGYMMSLEQHWRRSEVKLDRIDKMALTVKKFLTDEETPSREDISEAAKWAAEIRREAQDRLSLC